MPHRKSCLDGNAHLAQYVDAKSTLNRRFIYSIFPRQPILNGDLLLCVGPGTSRYGLKIHQLVPSFDHIAVDVCSE